MARSRWWTTGKPTRCGSSWAEPGDRGRGKEETMGDQQPADEDLDRLPTDQELGRLQWTTVLYDLHETNPDNWLVRDKTDPAAPSSIAANGLALAGLPVVAEHGEIGRAHV